MTSPVIPQSLKSQLLNGNVIPLVGAGVSMSVKTLDGERAFPSWRELLLKGAIKLEDEGKEKESQLVTLQVELNKFHDAAKTLKENLKGKTWGQFLDSIFAVNSQNLDPGSKELPLALWKLSNRIITLNYDRIMLWGNSGSSDVVDFDNSNNGRINDFACSSIKSDMLWHLHGKISEPKHMVLTPDSYDRFYDESARGIYEAALSKLKEVISNKVMLFVGCSLEDVELLDKINAEDKLFDGNTGPHYVLVREAQKDNFKDKLVGSNIEIITFSDFGSPLVDLLNNISAYKQAEEISVDDKEDNDFDDSKDCQIDKICLLTSSPLDRPVAISDVLAKMKKYKYPICHQPLTENNVMNADGFSVLFIVAINTSSGLLIEDDNACSDYISICDLGLLFTDSVKIVILITDKKVDEKSFNGVDFPLIILPLIGADGRGIKVLDRFQHQLFKKKDIGSLSDNLIRTFHVDNDLLDLINLEGKAHWSSPSDILSKKISHTEVQGFIGRCTDLADISQKLSRARDNKRLLTVKGSGGLGKTTIVKKVAFELSNRGAYSGGVYFVDCEKISTINQFEMSIGDVFSLRSAEDVFEHLSKNHDQLERLIILDNLESILHLKENEVENRAVYNQVCEIISRSLEYANIVATSRELVGVDWEDCISFRQMESEEALDLFNHLTKNHYESSDDQVFARRKILEPLLNNNPLAIKLICDGMPKGKSLFELSKELNEDFFGCINEEDLSIMFNEKVDENITRQESLYVSILYSYKTLTQSQKRTFEIFSLFPDGISFNNFKKLFSKADSGYDSKGGVKKTVSDKDIAALANKSLIEVNNGSFYKLQSVIQRFAKHQFERHTDDQGKSDLYRQAYFYNDAFIDYLYSVIHKTPGPEGVFFNLSNNFVAAIEYGVVKNVIRSQSELESYFNAVERMVGLAVNINMTDVFLSALERADINSAIIDKDDYKAKVALEILKTSCSYYLGDFQRSYDNLKKLVPIETVNSEGGIDDVFDSIIITNSLNIYCMEGKALDRVECRIKKDLFERRLIDVSDVQTGYDVSLLFGLAMPDKFYFEALGYLKGGIDLHEIDYVIDNLNENSHLERVSLIYIKSRFYEVDIETIESLVDVNPYTKGLKDIMYAICFERIDDRFELIVGFYESAILRLDHIKFYCVQAYYFYAKYLNKKDIYEFERVYDIGLGLAMKYHYRYWQHMFLSLRNSSLGNYDAANYPLPGNPDISDLLNKQASWIKKRYGKKLNNFSK